MPRIINPDADKEPPALPVLRYDPRELDLERWLGPTEAQVMSIFWSAGKRPLSVRAVARTLDDDRAYTTIMTTCARLAQKGMLLRTWQGGAYMYATRETRAEFEQRQLEALLESLADEVAIRADKILAGQLLTIARPPVSVELHGPVNKPAGFV